MLLEFLIEGEAGKRAISRQRQPDDCVVIVKR
jgi:hypothetical protein